MKEINTSVKKSFVKKIFIKICRLFGYEIIDQSNFSVPSQNKSLNDNLNIHGSKSITLPLGEVKVTRKINALTVIFRSCTSVKMLTQSKERLFNKDKNEYTFRSLHSIISSLHQAKENFPGIKFNPSVFPNSSLSLSKSCIPKQIPKNGTPFFATDIIVSSRFKSLIDFIALAKAPTPGRIIRDELLISF